MLYPANAFIENFTNAAGVDPHGAMDILINAVNDAIISDRAGVIDALAKSGVNIRETASNREIVSAVSNEIYDNKDFINKLSELLSEKYYNADGEDKDSKPALINAIAGAVGSVAGIFSGGQQNKAAKEQTKQMMLANLMAKQNPPAGLSGLAIAGIIVGAMVVVGALGFVIYKMATKK